MSAPERLVLVANARLPSQRAQSLQVVHAASAFARAGVETALVHARRHPTPELPEGQDLFEYYAVAPGPRPEVVEVDCVDWIDRVPRALQYGPARVQELTFARNSAQVVKERFAGAAVLSRELETARALTGDGRGNVFLEIHRVPESATRRRWLKQALDRAAGCLAISGGVRDDLLELGAEPSLVRVEHDAFEATRFEAARFANAPSRAEARTRLGIDGGRAVCVYAGGLMAWKGVALLIRAARKLSGIEFLVVGGADGDRERIANEESVPENVRLVGFVAPGEVATYLRAADFAAVPNRSRPRISSHYTSPLKVFEAMACGLPLVASDLPSLRDVLSEDEALFVIPDDVDALAAGIQRLARDEGLRARLSQAMERRAPEHTFDARAQRILAWMAEMGG